MRTLAIVRGPEFHKDRARAHTLSSTRGMREVRRHLLPHRKEVKRCARIGWVAAQRANNFSGIVAAAKEFA